jgi:deoxyribose-phosphate aldolase
MKTITELLQLAGLYEAKLPDLTGQLQLPSGPELAAWIDHTLLKPEATSDQVEQLCREALDYGFASVCINPVYVPLAAKLLLNSNVKVCTVIGFPLGAVLPGQKAYETLSCLDSGATEIDMVIHVGSLKAANYTQVLSEIQAVCEFSHRRGALVKVILEMALLSRSEKIIGCLLAQEAGADFVKTSTGFGPGGAKVEDVDLMYRVVGSRLRVKAAGGVRSLADAEAMMRAGASRLGSSAGVQIMKEAGV